MLHFIYKTTSKSGKYYIGRHSTKKMNDGYYGSGKWIRSIKDKSELTREILEFCAEEELMDKEKKYISEHIGLANCMNFNQNPVGFASGHLNPSCAEESRKRSTERIKGDKNPAKCAEVRKKISDALKGKPRPKWKMTDEGRKNISKSRIGLKYSEEGKRKLSESRKREFEEGKRIMPSFAGISHKESTLKTMSEKALNRPKYKCEYCDVTAQIGPLTRFHNQNCKLKNDI